MVDVSSNRGAPEPRYARLRRTQRTEGEHL